MALTKLDQMYRAVILDEAQHPRHHGFCQLLTMKLRFAIQVAVMSCIFKSKRMPAG
ncbi:NifU family SUF system FeS assembly protein [Lacticaseibacillus paracasei subsp. paracasei Lpp221]|nr:NifU family SUF system FeS assembly protein [Lacticaseibacillus paracasei subsp. paracasei Lpp221]